MRYCFKVSKKERGEKSQKSWACGIRKEIKKGKTGDEDGWVDGWVGERTHGTRRRMRRDCQGRATRRIERS